MKFRLLEVLLCFFQYPPRPTHYTSIDSVVRHIWGVEANNISPQLFHELNTILANNLTSRFGSYQVRGDQGIFYVLKLENPCTLSTCMVSNAAFKCSRCDALYCSKEHQSQDWKSHKQTCIQKQ
ncbi:MAG: hypothetical protein RLZZ453_170 [Chlamydiota bacterium]|jgi:hypothetical protein